MLKNSVKIRTRLVLLWFLWSTQSCSKISAKRLHTSFVPSGGSKKCRYCPLNSRDHSRRAYLNRGAEEISDPASILSRDQLSTLADLVEQRAKARFDGDYKKADALRLKVEEVAKLPDDIFVSIKDIARKDGGGSTWSIQRKISNSTSLGGNTVLQLAHKALGLAVLSSEKGVEVDELQLNSLINQAQDRLRQSAEVELRGRKAADAAFWFAMAGGIRSSNENSLLYKLADIAANELQRFGSRPSCRTKDILQILERFAAAGLLRHEKLEHAAYTALQCKQDHVLTEDKNLLDFHSHHCLMSLWKFSTRQRKQRVFMEMARNHWLDGESHPSQEVKEFESNSTFDWNQIFEDPTKPLVLDVGCGMGVSLLGLAKHRQERTNSLVDDWENCNFAGVDLSGLAITYANSIASTWDLNSILHFFRGSADEFITKRLTSYPGPIVLCLIQFPTPYRLDLNPKEKCNVGGNIQLPSSATDKHFMVSNNLLQGIECILDKRHGGKLIIQSNCEDVAIWIRNLALSHCNFQSIESAAYELSHEPSDSSGLDLVEQTPTKRTIDWISIAGDKQERARGPNWCSRPILPPKGRTETEVACLKNGTPVHRCILTVK